ncbi:MAG: hypothetical protein ACR5K7_03985 [Symbiopectobacterium sp.]
MIDNLPTGYRENPVRILRAVRFSAKLNMTHQSPRETAELIPRFASDIAAWYPHRTPV